MRLLMLWYYIISSILLILLPFILLVENQTEYKDCLLYTSPSPRD